MYLKSSIAFTENLNDKVNSSDVIYDSDSKDACIFISNLANATDENVKNQLISYLGNLTGHERSSPYNLKVIYHKASEEGILVSKYKSDLITRERNEAENELLETISSVDISDDYMGPLFRKQIISWLEKYHILALDLLWQNYKDNKFSPPLLSKILELVGAARLNDLNSVRIELLKCVFDSENVEIRHGSVEGLSNLDPNVAIPVLENILMHEDNKVLSKTISSYLDQLKNLHTT